MGTCKLTNKRKIVPTTPNCRLLKPPREVRVRFLPARRYASAGTSYGPVTVCSSVRLFYLSQVGVLWKRGTN